ncbi:MAG: amidohydrolase family protein [Candidatus Kariarchaeaceae archaeon]|jgi:imidazolonepropionase-like amidohydrolase
MIHYIQADKAIDGLGDVINDAVIAIENGIITKFGQSESFNLTDSDTVFTTPVVMPGLWDSHVHLFGGTSTDMRKWLEDPTTTRAIRATRSVKNLLNAGFTSARDAGGPYSLRLKQAINEGVIPGPHLYGAHKFISQTAGHGDHHPSPLSWQTSEAADWYSHLADGIAECRKAARMNIREGADLIKIFVTGGVFSHIDSPEQAHFSMEELEAIIQEANRFDLATAAHAHGREGIRNAVNAGITTIEHGTYLDESTAQLMVEKNVILVPTFHILKVFLAHKDELGLPEHIAIKGEETGKIHAENIKIAVKEGVQIAAGSDLVGLGDALEHGHGNAAELVWLTEAGLSPMEAIVAATSTGPKTLGQGAPNSGSLEEGKVADLLCLESNPVDDLTILQNKNQINRVYKSGNAVSAKGQLL